MDAAEQQGSHRIAAPPHGPAAEQQERSYLVREAADIVGIPERTIHAWIKQGRIPVLAPPRGQRGVRLSAKTLDELREAKPLQWDGERFLGEIESAPPQQRITASATSPQSSNPAVAPPHSSSTAAGPQQSSSVAAPPQTGPVGPVSLPPAIAARISELEAEVARLREKADGAQTACRVHAARRAETERIVTFQQQQMEHSRQAEVQLRVLLGQQGMALLKALERMALPPAESPAIEAEPAQRRPWWRRWGR